jgi:hypothetical protein
MMILGPKLMIMRNFRTLSKLIILSLILFACERNDDNNSPKHESLDSVLKAEKDSKSWIATKTWSYFNKKYDKFTLSGAMEDSVYFQEEVLNIFIENKKIVIGEKLRDFDAQLSFIIGGDGVAWRYEKTENIEDSYIIINELDTVNNRIRGAFDIRLKNARSTEKYYMNLKNGEFDLTYEVRNTN